MFDKSTALIGKGIYSNGNVINNQWTYASDYIEVLPDTIYTISGNQVGSSNNNYYAFYDSSKNFISSTQQSVQAPYTFTTPSNAQYLRFTIQISQINNAMLNIGSSALSYEPYGKWYNENYVSTLEEKIQNINLGCLSYLNYLEFSNIVTGEPIEIDGVYEYDLQYLIDNNLVHDTRITLNHWVNSTTNPNDDIIYLDMYFNGCPLEIFAMYFGASIGGNVVSADVIIYDSNSHIYTTNINSNSPFIDFTSVNQLNIINVEEVHVHYNSTDSLGYIAFNDLSTYYYNNGWSEGYCIGKKDGISMGNAEGYNQGYSIGKSEGIEIGSDQNNTLYGMIIAVVDAPINIFKNIFNFDILGINLAGVVFGIITLLLIIYLIKKLI